MTVTNVRLLAVCVSLTALAACTTSPTSPSGSITVTVPSLATPANGALIANLSQPVTLTVNNALVTTSGVGVSYTFEVSTDAGFATIVATKTATQGASGQTSVTLGILAAGKDYFWHVSTTGGDTVGAFSNPQKFTIGPAITVGTPTPISPANGAANTALRPTFLVNNAPHTGPVGTMLYKFDVSTSSSFGTIVATSTVVEGTNGQTSFTPSSDLGQGTTYFWRVSATDASTGISGGFTGASSLTTSKPSDSQAGKIAQQQGVTLWPGVQPPGTVGNATMGDSWGVGTVISFHGVAFLSPPIDMLRVFDLMDRGMAPQAAIDWMHGNGYATTAAWFPGPAVIGFDYQYLAFIAGRWDVVLRGE